MEKYSQGSAFYKKITDGLDQKGSKVKFKVVYGEDKYGSVVMTYYINDKKMGENINFKHDKMNKFGFMAFNDTEIEVDYIKVHGTKMAEEVKEDNAPNEMQIATARLGESPSSSSSPTIKAGEAMYAKVFLKKSFYDLMKEAGYRVKMQETVYINNEAASEYEWTMDGAAIKGQGNFYEAEMAPPISETKYPK